MKLPFQVHAFFTDANCKNEFVSVKILEAMAESEFKPNINYSPDTGAGGGGREDLTPEQIEELVRGVLRRTEQEKYVPLQKTPRDVYKELQTLADEKASTEEKDEAKERLGKDYERINIANLRTVKGLSDKYLHRMMNPFPYDTRYPEIQITNDNESFEEVGMEVEGREADVWLDRLTSDNIWAGANLEFLATAGPVVQFYYDGKKMLRVLTNSQRNILGTKQFLELYKSSLPGLIVEGEDKEALLTGEAKEGLRKKATKFQDESMFWRMAVASLSQENPNYRPKPGEPETGPLIRLSSPEKEFLGELFYQPGEGEEEEWSAVPWVDIRGEKLPKTTLNFYGMGGSSDVLRDRYLLLMEGLLVTNAYEELEKLQHEAPSGEQAVDTTSLQSLIQKVKDYYTQRKNSYYSRKRSFDSRVAETVVKTGMSIDYGLMMSSAMGWRWNLKDQKTELGGPHTSLDVSTVIAYTRHEIEYDAKGRIRTYFLPPSDPQIRSDIEKYPPGWGPEITDYIKTSPGVSKAMEILTLFKKDRGEFDVVLKGLEINKEYKQVFEEMAWAWITPFKDRNGEKLVVPMFMPTRVLTPNYFDSVKTGSKDKETVWGRLARREKLSEIDWQKIGYLEYDNWTVSMEMMGRWLSLMIGPADERDIATYFENPKNVGELLKRVDLGGRHEKRFATVGGETKEVPRQVYEVTIIPQMIAYYTAYKLGIIGKKGGSEQVLTEWKDQIKEWAVAIMNLDETKGGSFKNYRETMVLMLFAHEAAISRIALDSVIPDTRLSDETIKRVDEVFKKSR